MMKNNKIIIIIVGLLLVGGGAFFVLRPRNKTPEKENIPVVEQTEALDPTEIPYFSLTPQEANHKLSLAVIDGKGFDNIEYELIYELEEGLTRGVTGEINLTEKSRKEILLGTCSSGSCRFDEGVTGGELTIQLEREGKIYSSRAPFVFLEKGDTYTAPDGSLSLTAQNSFCLLTNSGLPTQPKDKILAGPFILSNGSGNSQAGLEDYKGNLLVWQNEQWQEAEETSQLQEGTYLLVK